MAIFEYSGFDDKGKKIRGIVEADNEKAARQRLKAQGVFPTDISQIGEEASKKKWWELSFSDLFSRVTLQDIAVMTRQLATLLRAGIPLIEALDALIEQMEKVRIKRILASVKEKVNEGASLAEALEPYRKIFGPIYVNMIKAGESSGTLEIVLERLADYFENQVKLRNKLYSSLTYPVILFFLMGGVVIFLFIFVIPRITLIFQEMRHALPIYTRILIGFVNFLRATWWALLLLLMLALYLFKRFIDSEKGRYWWDGFILRFPLIGNVLKMVAIARFSRTLGTLLSSGVNIVTSLEIVKNIVNNKVLEKAIEDARVAVIEGASLATPLADSGVFPPIVIKMIAVGEKTGEIETMLMKVADTYEDEVEAFLNAVVSIVEPIMIILLAGLVFFIMISILLPLFQMNQLIK